MESRMPIDRRKEGRMENGEVGDNEDEEDEEKVVRGGEEVEIGVSKWLSSL